jgi:hypothetical protein
VVDDKRSKNTVATKAAKARADRLAEALRANLKRRKTQARAQADEPGPSALNGRPGEKNR